MKKQFIFYLKEASSPWFWCLNYIAKVSNSNRWLVFIVLLSFTRLTFCMQPLYEQLLKAIKTGDFLLVQDIIVNHKVDCTGKDIPHDKLEKMPLYYAVKKGNIQLTALLLEHGGDPNTQHAGKITSLHRAVRAHNAELAKLLLEHGAQADRQDDKGFTPLHDCALSNGPHALFKILIKKTRNLNTASVHGVTPLHYTCRALNLAGAKALVKYGAKVNVTTLVRRTPLHLCLLPTMVTGENQFKLVKLLLDHGADVALCDNEGKTPLALAVHYNFSRIVELLIVSGSPISEELINHPSVIKAFSNQAVLNNAVSNADLKQVITLLKQGFCANKNVDMFLNLKLQQLFTAVMQDDPFVVKQLLKQAFSLTTCDKLGNTLLHKAFECTSKKVIEFILSITGSADILCKKNKAGITPLEIALTKSDKHSDFIKSLLKKLEKGPQSLSHSSACTIV
ncbi:ankyrin repeat domain-containing protein [Candidatus Dependentiae bacterium]|nr:ankyrin repeat domain-containing protein [Candidatus Dependentiae bacterium]